MSSNFCLKVGSICLFFLFLVGAWSVSSAPALKQASLTKGGVILYVGGSGLGNYSRIQDGVDNASDGDTVFVYDDAAPYYENVVVNVSIHLIGEDRNTTSIEGGHHAVTLYASGVTVSGFRISNVGDFWNCCGFYVISNDNSISGNNIVNNLRMNGVFLDGGSYNTITGNIIENNNYHGVRLEFSSHNVIEDNRIVNNRGYGIYLWESTDNLLVGNTVKQSFWDGLFLGDNSEGNSIFHNNFVENLVNAYDGTGNAWDNGSAGNYWSDYMGFDNDSNGIGDSPYQIPGNVSSDMFPLMEPYGGGEPNVEIMITGGFGVTVTVKNVGAFAATDVDWTVCFEGGLLFLPVQRCYNGTIPEFAPGQIVEIFPADLLFGVGVMNVNVTVGSTAASLRGFVLVFFFVPLPG